MRTIILSVEKAGHINQCLAFCEASGWDVGAGDVVTIPAAGRMTDGWERVRLRLRRRLATRRAQPRERQAGRLRIVASGHAAEPVVAAYRRLYGSDLFAIFLGRPKAAETIFDVALMARHALSHGESAEAPNVPGARRVDVAGGVLVRKMALEANPQGLAALIGGVNKAYEIDAERLVGQFSNLAAARSGEPLSIAFSRRTPGDVERVVRRAFHGTPIRFVDRDDRRGFETVVARTAEFVVTPDSLTMTCEVCATGRPVRVFDLKCLDPQASTHLFVSDFLARGYVSLSNAAGALGCPPELFDVPALAIKAHDAWGGAIAAMRPAQFASPQAA